jgi:hypothetical protein
MKKLLLTSVAVLLLATGAAAEVDNAQLTSRLATETASAATEFDWGAYCGPNNERCDPSDAEEEHE